MDSDDDTDAGAESDGNDDADVADLIETVVASQFPAGLRRVEAANPASLSSSSLIAQKVAENQLRSESVWGFSPGAIIAGKSDAFHPMIEGQTFPLYDADSPGADSILGATRAGLSAFQASVEREARNQFQDSRVQSSQEYTTTFAGHNFVRGGGTLGCGSKYRRRDATTGDVDGSDAGGPAAAAGGGHASTMGGSVPLGVLSDEQKCSVETNISADGHSITNSCAGRVHTNSACSNRRLGGLLDGGVDASGKAERLLKVRFIYLCFLLVEC